MFLGDKSLADTEEPIHRSQPHLHPAHTSRWKTCVVWVEGGWGKKSWRRNITGRTQKGWKALTLGTRPPCDDSKIVFFSSTHSFICPHSGNKRTSYLVGELVQSWTSFFQRQACWATLWTRWRQEPSLSFETSTIREAEIALVVLFQDLNLFFDTCSHIILLYCGQVYSCIFLFILKSFCVKI